MRITPLRGIYRFTHILEIRRICSVVGFFSPHKCPPVLLQTISKSPRAAAERPRKVWRWADAQHQHKRSPSSCVKLDVRHQETGRVRLLAGSLGGSFRNRVVGVGGCSRDTSSGPVGGEPRANKRIHFRITLPDGALQRQQQQTLQPKHNISSGGFAPYLRRLSQE